jgi:diguanylate cyclase (GGDEF)-like protein/PAS domain S-box-containing protein
MYRCCKGMTTRDESAGDVAPDGPGDDRLLPAAGNYRGLVEGLPLIVYIDGPEAGSPSLYVSPQTSSVLGYTPEDWASSPDFFVSILHPDDRDRVVQQTAQMLETGERSQVEYRVLRPDGRVVWLRDEGVVVRDAEGRALRSQGYMLDVTELKRSQARASAQAGLLELIAAGGALPEVLDQIARFVEEQSEDDLLASILLLDREGVHLRHGAAPHLPEFWREAVDGIAIGPCVGSCGTAAYRRERVCTSDISTDPLWEGYRELAEQAGLRACWSTPFFATDGALLGTFALYSREPHDCGHDDGELVGLATHLAGIAIERARSGDAARTSEDRYRDLVENANEPIGTVTMTDEITEVNRAFERVLGYTREELIGTNLADYLTPEGLREAREATARKRSGEVAGTTFEQEFFARDGHRVILEVSSRVIEEGGEPIGVQGICRDITARKQAEVELRHLSEQNRHLSLHDNLTGLPNRASFREQVEQAIGLADARGSELAVLLMDLDRFKEINDTLGHHYGDLLLIELARRLEGVLRRTDSVARLGGDEFGVLVRDVSESAAVLEHVLSRILGALEQPFLVDGLPLYVEASIGVARYPAHGADVDVLLQRADVAMYVAKDAGSPHAIYTAEHDHHDTASLTLLSELPRAIRDRELVLHYQPKIDVQTGELAGVEALTRWQHPTRGLIPPGDFVAAAEKTGLMHAFTLYVLDEALGQLARWSLDGHDVNVAVNLSMRNLLDPRLPEQVADALDTWQLCGDRLTFEITESAIISDPVATKGVIQRLKALGVGISIDDFGTGYTSLACLARLPITQLKIDRSFVLAMNSNADDAAIVRSIITLGHDLALEVVAEGVETAAAYDQLALLGCDTIQGYLLSPPLPPDELRTWLGGRASGLKAA